MQHEPLTTEERLARLERNVADLQRQRQMQEARDSLGTQIQDLSAELKDQSPSFALTGHNISVLAEVARDHKDQIDALVRQGTEHQAGLQSVAGDVTLILDILRGQQKIND